MCSIDPDGKSNSFHCSYEPISAIIENRASVVKFRISFYFVEETSIVKYSKITLKVSMAFYFFRNRAKFENTAHRPPSNSEIGGKLHIFILLVR